MSKMTCSHTFLSACFHRHGSFFSILVHSTDCNEVLRSWLQAGEHSGVLAALDDHSVYCSAWNGSILHGVSPNQSWLQGTPAYSCLTGAGVVH